MCFICCMDCRMITRRGGGEAGLNGIRSRDQPLIVVMPDGLRVLYG